MEKETYQLESEKPCEGSYCYGMLKKTVEEGNNRTT
jgi:hypothetical protein